MKKTLFSVGTLALWALGASSVFAQSAKATIGKETDLVISRHIYGQFAEHLGRGIYDGFWVDAKMPVKKQDRVRLDIVEALKKIKIPNLRWPGGCFADEYHWRDGIGARTSRPKMINTNWGGVTEDNSFGTHEFLELCRLLNTEPYITGNVGSGTVQEMSNWVEYLNFDGKSPFSDLRAKNGHPKPYNVTFWGVGNESWGCGGNMTPEYYADEYKRYAIFAKDYGKNVLKKIATGPAGDNYNWTEVVMKNVKKDMWGIALHYYTLPTGSWTGSKGSATKFTEDAYFNTLKNGLKMEEFVTKHSAIMDKYDPDKKVALVVDEWGVWTDSEPGTNPGFLYQQNSLRDALVAASTLNIFNNHADRVKLANLAQTINVLQALILTQKEKIILTPTYHVFDMYKVHQDAKLLPIKLDVPDYEFDGKKLPAVNVSASKDASGKIHLTIVNIDNHKDIDFKADLGNVNWSTVTGQILTGTNVTNINTFANPNNIKLVAFNDAKKDGSNISVKLPAHSVVSLELK
jgi:alpha-N-arabinofuranosidase